jgi:DNA-directed RNA polymerase subunit L/DNA-directed RNA polymerase alpha subunit
MARETPVFRDLKNVDSLTVTFQLQPSHVSYANTLRRAVLTEVETVGFRSDIKEDGSTSDVTIEKNTTPMTNEMLADRVGLLPIWVENPLTWDPEEYTFRIAIESDKDTSRDVVAADFEVLQRNKDDAGAPTHVGNAKFFQPNPITRDTCLIAILKGKQPNQAPQAIELTARATIGTGRQHVRFNPVSQCSYKYTIDTDSEKQKTVFEKWLQTTKKVDPKSLEKETERRDKLMREFNTMEVERCFLVNEKNEPYSFDFTVESKGTLPVKYIIGRALEKIQQKCMLYASVDRGDLPENMRIQPADARMKGFDIILQGEDHTLGNLLQTWMDENMIDKEEITYVGYKLPHPLRDEMVFRIGVEDGQEITARAMFARAARACATMFGKWKEDWTTVSTGVSVSAAVATKGKKAQPNVKAVQLAPAPVPEPAAPILTATPAAPAKKRGAFWGKPLPE